MIHFLQEDTLIVLSEPPPPKSRAETSPTPWIHFHIEEPTMNRQKVKKISVKRVEDTDALRWARVANRGEEKRGVHRIKVIERAAAIRCSDLDREKAALERILVKVNASTGYLQGERTQNLQLQQ